MLNLGVYLYVRRPPTFDPMDPQYRELLRAAFDEFLGARETQLEPDDHYLPYEYPYITQARWRIFADTMLLDELREFTNRLHEWRDMLRRWHAWNKVISTREEIPAWDLRREFMEPLVHTCLLMPSAVRDLATFVGTNALHQVRIHIDPGYADVLEGDPSAATPKPQHLTRGRKERRLEKLSIPLDGASGFIQAIQGLDNEDYRAKTKDYRNLNSHSIGPRIALGQTKIVTRQVVPATRMEVQPDGTERVDRYAVSYRYGGLEPLDLEAARVASLEQYKVARTCFDHFTALLERHSAKLPRADAYQETPLK